MKVTSLLAVCLLAIATMSGACGGSGGGGSAPAAPTNVTAAAAWKSATITWDAVSDATSYNVYYGTDTWMDPPLSAKTSMVEPTKIENVTSPYSVASLTNGTDYYFAVTAVNASGESSYSTEVSAVPYFSGTLDTTYGTNGYFQSDAFASSVSDLDMPILQTADPSGNTYMAFSFDALTPGTCYVIKVDESGLVVSSFGTNGVASISPPNVSDCHPFDIIADSSAVFLAGNVMTQVPSTVGIIAKIDSSTGAIDSSFANGGYVIVDGGTLYSEGFAADGSSLFTCGVTQSGSSLVAKYKLNDGSFDTSFASTGYMTYDFGGAVYNSCTALALDASDNIFAASYHDESQSAESGDIVLTKIKSDGSGFENTFGTSGQFDTGARGYIYSVLYDGSNIYASGKTIISGSGSVIPTTYKVNSSTGSFDTSFATGGAYTISDMEGQFYDSLVVGDAFLGLAVGASTQKVVALTKSNGVLATNVFTDGFLTAPADHSFVPQQVSETERGVVVSAFAASLDSLYIKSARYK